MSNPKPLPPVRMRTRPQPQQQPGDSAPKTPRRLIANPDNTPRKKRLPNSGSFKNGEPSRNPNGRPKGAKGHKAVVRKILLELVSVRLPTGPRKISAFEALYLKERDLAFSGDWRARKTMLELGRWALPEDVVAEAGLRPVTDSEVDRAILDWFEEDIRRKPRKKGGGDE